MPPAVRPGRSGAATVEFTWVDGERLIRFAGGALGGAAALLSGRGFDGYALLTTERAAAIAPVIVEGAARVLHVPSGPVPEAAASVREGVGGRPIVALGGGRVIDSGKAIAAADGLRCAAIPTTLSGAPLTPFHRAPAGAEGSRLVRPSLVIADPELMASQPMPKLAASAMNALAHAVEALYAPLANPVAEGAALRAATLLSGAIAAEPPARADLALGALLAGYAVGSTGFAVHHAVCQTVVRTRGTPHAETNAVVLPHSVAFMANRAPEAIGRLAPALGASSDSAAGAAPRVAEIAALAGPTRLSDLGIRVDALPEVVAAALEHPAMANTPPSPPGAGELRRLLESAL
jgi:alcohol dehydrogenase class IV